MFDLKCEKLIKVPVGRIFDFYRDGEQIKKAFQGDERWVDELLYDEMGNYRGWLEVRLGSDDGKGYSYEVERNVVNFNEPFGLEINEKMVTFKGSKNNIYGQKDGYKYKYVFETVPEGTLMKVDFENETTFILWKFLKWFAYRFVGLVLYEQEMDMLKAYLESNQI